MKSYNNLWEKFISKENFELAYQNSIKGKLHQKQIRRFNEHKEENLEKVRQLVISGKFHTSQYRQMTIYEPKERIIYKLPYCPDRIVQHAIMNILKPIFTKLFIKDTYACIEGRGQHKASIKCSEFVRRNEYCLKCDIRKFYPSINQYILSDMLHKLIADKRFMAVIDDIVFSFEGGKNCPIGNYCSQWFGNFYLSKLDNFVKHNLKCKDYERFCDDFLLFSNDKNYLNRCKKEIGVFIKEKLDLEFSKCDLFKTKQGVDFCGYRHFGKYVLLRKTTAKRMKRRIKWLYKNVHRLDNDFIRSSIASTNGWLRWCCSWNLKKRLNLGANSYESICKNYSKMLCMWERRRKSL